MPELSLTSEDRVSPQLEQMLSMLSERTVRAMLLLLERKLTGTGGIIDRNYHSHAASQPPPSPAWAKTKARKGAPNRPFQFTGAARDAMTRASHPARGRRLYSKFGRIAIWLTGRKTTRAPGRHNPYDILQQGRFAGLQDETGKVETASATASQARRNRAAFAAARLQGSATNYRSFVRSLSADKKPGATLKGAVRRLTSGTAMPLMTAQPADAERAKQLLEQFVRQYLATLGIRL